MYESMNRMVEERQQFGLSQCLISRERQSAKGRGRKNENTINAFDSLC